jgi:acyl-CoA thioesterase I
MQMGALLLAVNVGVGAMVENARAQSPQPEKPIKMVAFGDSLTAGYLLPPDDAFPAQLARALAKRGVMVDIINAGVSGDTTAGGRDRLAWSIPEGTEAVILELGANDALRGLDPAAARRNLEIMIEAIRARKAEILLAGMMAPRSLGDPYIQAFDPIFPQLAAKHNLILYPFFLEKTGMDRKLTLPDGMHPNAKGVAAIVEDILPQVEALIAKVKAARASRSKG